MIGVDIVLIKRIEALQKRFGQKGLERYLLPSELRLCSRIETAAGFWAAKEAIAKALGCGIGKELGFKEIEIYKDEKGAPRFRLLGDAKRRFGLKEAALSISHDGGFAIAVAAIELLSPSSDES